MAGLTRADVLVVMPAHNEEKALPKVLERVAAIGFPVLVVDDGSRDRTANTARAAGAEVLSHATNRGKGAALRSGFAWALASGYRAVITMDADGQHDALELPLFVDALNQGRFDVVVGDRTRDRRSMPPLRRATNRFMSWMLSALAGQRIPDTQCGFRALTRPVLEAVRMDTDHYEIESEMLLAASRAGFRIGAMPIHCIYGEEKSQINPLRDTWRFVRFLVTHRHLFR